MFEQNVVDGTLCITETIGALIRIPPAGKVPIVLLQEIRHQAFNRGRFINLTRIEDGVKSLL